jgi:hypothetical protein
MVISVLRLVAMQMDIVEYATNSIARLDCLVGFFTARVAHPALDGFLRGT